jgi:hypothetical protein
MLTRKHLIYHCPKLARTRARLLGRNQLTLFEECKELPENTGRTLNFLRATRLGYTKEINW